MVVQALVKLIFPERAAIEMPSLTLKQKIPGFSRWQRRKTIDILRSDPLGSALIYGFFH
jgi:hypothetical protein